MWIILAILALPLVEIALFVTLGGSIGLWLTLAWVLLTGVVGVLILRTLSVSGAIRGRQEFVEGFRGRVAEDPLSPMAHQALIGAAAVLLILPGFFTDAMGLLLLVPFVRTILIRLAARRMQGVMVVRQTFGETDDPYERGANDDRLN